MLEHLALEQLDSLAQVFLAQRVAGQGVSGRLQVVFCALLAVNSIDHLLYALDYAGRSDALGEVVGGLTRSSALRFAQGELHRLGDLIGIKDGLAVQVPRRPADRLDQAPLGAKETLLVGGGA